MSGAAWVVDGVAVRWWEARYGACLADGRITPAWPPNPCVLCGNMSGTMTWRPDGKRVCYFQDDCEARRAVQGRAKS